MSENDQIVTTREDALAKKKAARSEVHLRGFGNNRFPQCDKIMSDEQAARGLANLAKSALGITSK